MSHQCDHCDTAILQGVEAYEGDHGSYCSGVCRYDAEVLEIVPGWHPPVANHVYADGIET